MLGRGGEGGGEDLVGRSFVRERADGFFDGALGLGARLAEADEGVDGL